MTCYDHDEIAFRREPIVSLRDFSVFGEEWLLDSRPFPSKIQDWLMVLMAFVGRLPYSQPVNNHRVFVNAHSSHLSLSALQPLWITLAQRCASKNKKLIIEWTEIASPYFNEAVAFLDILRKEHDVLIAIDDVGSAGFDSFWRMTKARPDIIKIDGSFFHESMVDKDAQYWLRKIIENAQDKRIMCVIEWIETADDLDSASAFGAELGQGFYWTKNPENLILNKLVERSVQI